MEIQATSFACHVKHTANISKITCTDPVTVAGYGFPREEALGGGYLGAIAVLLAVNPLQVFTRACCALPRARGICFPSFV